MLASVRRLPAEPGVYRFRDDGGRVLYIGRATQLRPRVGSYWSHLGDRPHLARMVGRIDRVEALVCASVHEAAWLERNLLEVRMPRWNRTPGGQEVPVYLRLDDGPARPGLKVSHRSEEFGPYLGGARARSAVAALHRLFPLPYAGTGLSGAERDMAARVGGGPADRDMAAGVGGGPADRDMAARVGGGPADRDMAARVGVGPAERDMAARVGVGPADRAGLAVRIRAVLAREPGAVAAAERALIERRDEAAEQTRYERAGRIQAELDGLRWITDEQRATTSGGGDLDVAAWAGGVRLGIQIRNGRLCGWAVRRTANVPQSAPPPGWTAFAQRNAALAAELISYISLSATLSAPHVPPGWVNRRA